MDRRWHMYTVMRPNLVPVDRAVLHSCLVVLIACSVLFLFISELVFYPSKKIVLIACSVLRWSRGEIMRKEETFLQRRGDGKVKRVAFGWGSRNLRPPSLS